MSYEEEDTCHMRRRRMHMHITFPASIPKTMIQARDVYYTNVTFTIHTPLPH
jgi:hypothetical protein